ncbi:MAG: CDP-diacylglycerol--serine O-phosphatidyltransferase [Anaerolineaceae bacterium]|nr:CDP-diacylglycerol--serine O-phosphatidyltransferase [Anaerolineaceae bacterium]
MKARRLPMNRTWIPNSVTALSVFFGYLSIMYTFQGYFVTAAWLIVLAGILDSMDGKIARKVNACTKFGSYFDSLADAINYGVAPALLFQQAYFSDWTILGSVVTFLPIVCSAIRLARFNVLSEEEEKDGFFVGLPTTVAAGLLASFVIFMNELMKSYGSPTIAAGLMAISSLLMISAVPYEHNSIITRRGWKGLLLLLAVLTLFLFQGRALFAWVALYVTYGLFRSLLQNIRDLELRKTV